MNTPHLNTGFTPMKRMDSDGGRNIPTRLSDPQRESLLADLERDGCVVLHEKLPASWIEETITAMDRISREKRREDPSVASIKMQNCVDADPAFLRLMMYEPALQLCYDAFGPMFHLNQSNFVSRPRDDRSPADYISSSPWHADGPRPGLFPHINGVMGLHYLKFGFFLTDLTHADGGPLQVVRGSHKKPELDGNHKEFHIEDYAADLITYNCKAGTVVAFHQAQWHAAPPNQSEIERKNVYISYCPTWMRPLDRDTPSEARLSGCSREERWLLGEPRPPQRFWLPREDDLERMARFRRDGDMKPVETVLYE